MLKNIIETALKQNEFDLTFQVNGINYYTHQDHDSVRFAVVYELTHLILPNELNAIIKSNAPKELTQQPAFDKNCDLICILKIEDLYKFKVIEQQVFNIEEDPYQFKKYVLYYTKQEEELLQDAEYDELLELISDRKPFESYKANPTDPSKYSLIARIFIKIPFLELKPIQSEFIPLKTLANERVGEEGLLDLYGKIQNLLADAEDDLIEGLISNELENLSN